MSSSELPVLFLGLALIVALAQLAGTLARRCGQPPVIGEITAGILLGPTVLNGQLSEFLFPTAARGELSALAQLGLALFMFKLGMEFDWATGRGTRRPSVCIATVAMVIPFAVGAALGLWWRPGGSDVEGIAPVLFMGVALSVTAFPVLARIVEDRGLSRAPLGQTALASAALCDVLAWSALGVVMVLCGSGAPWRLIWSVPYLILLATVVRPLLRKLIHGGRAGLDLSLTCVGLLASAAATEWMGLHFIIGAFAFGVCRATAAHGTEAPESDEQHRTDGGQQEPERHGNGELRSRLGVLDSKLLLPVFFVAAGWQVDLSGTSAAQLLDLAVLLGAAVGSKFLAAAGAARLCGWGLRDSAVLGALLNTRGLTELIVLTAGRDLGLLDDTGYALLVTMTVLTTISTGPLLQSLLKPDATEHTPARPSDEPPRPRHGSPATGPEHDELTRNSARRNPCEGGADAVTTLPTAAQPEAHREPGAEHQ
ncbi:cation:proton antiporter [Streptomyces tubbatahanensis]|uniref:Cation:proton antiporter n=1 Tax=Streptomyces tubbatahanensis TaxID=2923272 RepID=A0ABY3XKU2_9ACTN|nr:cation:proton antiporter [Streptomyces tubbatahanensis]UNS95029.1 cation:proton antiporter [Streptomyces tubbatahanensis]